VEVLTWLKEQHQNLNLIHYSCLSKPLDPEIVNALETLVDKSVEVQRKSSRTVIMQVKLNLLYNSHITIGTLAPDPEAQHRLLDRVICTRECFTVPLGYKGTIIGIVHEDAYFPTYEVLFDKPFVGGLRFLTHLLNPIDK
jgi:5'-3' exoribonuclease 1